MAHVTCRLTAKNRDQLRNPTCTLAVIEYGLPFYITLLHTSSAGVLLRLYCLRLSPTRQRRDCDLNPGHSASESSTLTTLPQRYITLLHTSSAGCCGGCIDSCPVTSRSRSSWYWTEDPEATSDLYVVQTDFVPAFQLYSSNIVYLHCNLQLCLVGEQTCELKTPVTTFNNRLLSFVAIL